MFLKWALIIVVGGLWLSACDVKTEISLPKCQRSEVDLANYTDKGKKLENCFVEYPGEPTRQDKSYYIIEDICGQFTNEFVGNALGRTITKNLESTIGDVYGCSYFWNERGDYVSIILDYQETEVQKAGQEALGRKVEEEKEIPMKNMVVYQENGLINTIYLILGEKKFISIERSNTAGLTTDDLIDFAINLAKEIKNYK